MRSWRFGAGRHAGNVSPEPVPARALAGRNHGRADLRRLGRLPGLPADHAGKTPPISRHVAPVGPRPDASLVRVRPHRREVHCDLEPHHFRAAGSVLRRAVFRSPLRPARGPGVAPPGPAGVHRPGPLLETPGGCRQLPGADHGPHDRLFAGRLGPAVLGKRVDEALCRLRGGLRRQPAVAGRIWRQRLVVGPHHGHGRHCRRPGGGRRRRLSLAVGAHGAATGRTRIGSMSRRRRPSAS